MNRPGSRIDRGLVMRRAGPNPSGRRRGRDNHLTKGETTMRPNGYPTHYRQEMACGAVVSFKIRYGTDAEMDAFCSKVEKHLHRCPICSSNQPRGRAKLFKS